MRADAGDGAHPGRVARAIEAAQVWWLTWYYRGIKRFTRFLIRVVLWKKKEKDEDDYVFAGQSLPLSRIPIRSSKADDKRRALDYARKRSGDPRLSWGQARKRLKRWEREEREHGRQGATGHGARSSGRDRSGTRGVAAVHGEGAATGA